jgi:hypothetical protein
LLELADAGADLGSVALDQFDHVRAGWRAAIADAHDVANLGDTQADCLRRANERQAWQRVTLIMAVPRHCPY